MEQIMPFQYYHHPVRVIIHDETPWWVAKDVCDILEIKSHRNVIARLDDDEKGVHLMDSPGGRQKTTIVNEFGLYELIFRSDKPEAKAFRRWLKRDVLPQIRRTGAYAAPAAPDRLAALEARVAALEQRLPSPRLRGARGEPRLRGARGAAPRRLRATEDGYIAIGYAAALEGISAAGMVKRVKHGYYADRLRRMPGCGPNRTRLEIQTADLSPQAQALLTMITTAND